MKKFHNSLAGPRHALPSGRPQVFTMADLFFFDRQDRELLKMINEITDKNDTLCFYFTDFTFDKIQPLFEHPQLKGKVLLNAGERPHLYIRLHRKDDRVAIAETLVSVLLASAPAEKMGGHK